MGAIHQLTDQNVLAHIAKNDKDSDLRLEAAKKMKDQSILADMTKNVPTQIQTKSPDDAIYHIFTIALPRLESSELDFIKRNYEMDIEYWKSKEMLSDEKEKMQKHIHKNLLWTKKTKWI